MKPKLKKEKETMSNVALNTDVLKKALEAYSKKVSVAIKAGTKTTTVPFTDENKDLLEFLQDNIPLSAVQRTKINSWLVGPVKLSEVEASSVKELFRKVDAVNLSKEPQFEIEIAGKWYPVMVSFNKRTSWMGDEYINLGINAQIGSLQFSKYHYLGGWLFKDSNDMPAKKHINEILRQYGLRVASPESVAKAKELNLKVIELESQANTVVDVTGVGLTYHEWWGWSDMMVGWKTSPATAIVEPQLEDEYARENYDQEHNLWRLPFVRVFSLKHKDYIYVDVDSVTPHKFHPESKNKIVLPGKMMRALDSIFNAQQENLFGDIFHGRHGGIVVLANGPSGVGKTLTAEVFAEHQKRPLYSMEMGEIGTSLTNVEENLQKIFARAKKWNAVLLFDEADIFLSERVASDLERSAIVGVFLRLLDYYEGTFFLTTNRGEGIDKAFKSRVTLYLDYPELSPSVRQAIWTNMIAASGLKVTEDTPWVRIAEEKLNGRQIRNQVRLLKLMYPEGNVKTSDIMQSLEFAAR